jgi:type IV pilus assembly protein PilA
MTARKQIKNLKGFTLIELLVVIGILAVLLAITLIAINPGRQFAQANNTKRASDVNAILNAVHQYAVDNNGILPTGLSATTASTAIADELGGTGAFCTDLVPTYIAALPSDPQALNGGANITTCSGDWDTGYMISVANGRVTVTADDTEIPPATADISVTR